MNGNIRVFTDVLSNSYVGEPISYSGNVYALMAHDLPDGTLEKYGDDQPMAVIIDRAFIPFSYWKNTEIQAWNDVRIDVLPHGGVVSGIASLLGGVFKLVFGWLLPSQSNANQSRRTAQQGERIESADLKANTPRMGATVPEIFGQYMRYVDYLSEPRRRYIDNRTQVLEWIGCVGVGHYGLNRDDVYIGGSTPIRDLGDKAQVWLHNPNDDLNGHEPAQLWHTSPEVGGTSAGTAGIVLSVSPSNTGNSNPAGGYVFDGLNITRTDGSWPDSWGSDTEITVSYPRPYERIRERLYTTDDGPVYGTFYDGYFDHVDVSRIKRTISGDEFTLTIYNTLPDGRKTAGWRFGANWYDEGASWSGTHTEDFGANQVRKVSRISGQLLELQNQGYFFESGVTVQSNITFVAWAYGEYTSHFVATPMGLKTQLIEYDTMFPQGLCYMTDSGDVQSRSVTIETEFSDEDGIVPTVTVMRTYTEATRDQIGFTEQFWYAAPARARVRRRRVGVGSQSPNIIDEVNWYGLKARMPDQKSYPDWTTISIRVISGEQLGASAENRVSVLTRGRILPELQSDGSWSAPRLTRQISAASRYICESSGYQLADMNASEFLRLQNNYWTPRGETFDYVLDQVTSQKALEDCLGAGMSELTIDDGLITPVRDEPRTVFQQGYAPPNSRGGVTINFKPHSHEDHDGIYIEYMDARTWETETVRCFLPHDVGSKTRTVKLNGVTDRTRAYRFGMRMRLAEEYRRNTFTWDTEMDGMNSKYLDYVPLIDDLQEYGQAAEIYKVGAEMSGSVPIYSTEPLETEAGKNYVMAWRDEQGFVHGPYQIESVDSQFLIVKINDGRIPIVKMHQELPILFFGESERFLYKTLIQSAKPSGGIYARMTAINYDDRVYSYDNRTPEN